MSDSRSIRDIPDATKIDEGKSYLVKGHDLITIYEVLKQLWRGENIGKGPKIRLRSNGLGGITISGAQQAGGGNPSPAPSWPFKVYNTTTGSTGQVQVNGGDGQVAQLNGFVCNVNGNPSDTLISGAYPQLSVTGNGYIYAYAVPTTAGTASPLASLDLYYEGTIQYQSTANPAIYYWMLVATISNYNPDGRGTGMPSFDVNNVYGSAYGPSSLTYCGGAFNPPY